MGRVSVIGAGIAGLVAAKRVALAGHTVTVYEKCSSVGGRLSSRRIDGFTLDRGFQVLFTGYPFVREELDLEKLDLYEYANGAIVCGSNGRFPVVDPRADPGLVPEMLMSGPVGIRDALRLQSLRKELTGTARSEIFVDTDQPTIDWLHDRGFSESFIDSFARPFFGGFLLDRSLETSSCVTRYVLASLFAGETVIPGDGMRAIPEQLASQARDAGVTIETDSPVSEIDISDTVTIDGAAGIDESDAVIVATDPISAKKLTGIDEVPTSGKSVITQYYSHTNAPLDAGRKLLLNSESGAPNHIVQQSVVAPTQAPAGSELLSATFLESLASSASDLASLTREALRRWYPERELDLTVLATDRIEFAQFEQPPGIHAQLPPIRPTDDPLFLAGEGTTWSGIDGAIESGQLAAAKVNESLAT